MLPPPPPPPVVAALTAESGTREEEEEEVDSVEEVEEEEVPLQDTMGKGFVDFSLGHSPSVKGSPVQLITQVSVLQVACRQPMAGMALSPEEEESLGEEAAAAVAAASPPSSSPSSSSSPPPPSPRKSTGPVRRGLCTAPTCRTSQGWELGAQGSGRSSKAEGVAVGEVAVLLALLVEKPKCGGLSHLNTRFSPTLSPSFPTPPPPLTALTLQAGIHGVHPCPKGRSWVWGVASPPHPHELAHPPLTV